MTFICLFFKGFYLVFVLDSNNNSLSPTTNAKARRLLSSNKALVYKVYPFIIKLKKSFNSIPNPSQR